MQIEEAVGYVQLLSLIGATVRVQSPLSKSMFTSNDFLSKHIRES